MQLNAGLLATAMSLYAVNASRYGGLTIGSGNEKEPEETETNEVKK